ncbi:MAG TPA: 30S ribosomal protein S1 [Terriglobia bacterium]|nr:30S ribosomal protein S1 [Terriglobia bacterium]
MSSQENRAFGIEVIISPEAQNNGDSSMRQEPGGASGSAPEIRFEEEPVPVVSAPDHNPEPAAESSNEVPEAPAEVPAQETPLEAEAPAAPAEEATPPVAEAPAAPDAAASETLDASEAENLMESIGMAPALTAGEIVQGSVLKVTDDDVFVDLGLKSEAVIPRSEFLSADGQLNVAVGDTVAVLVEKFDELTGTTVVSRRKALQEELWEEIERVFYEETPIQGRVLHRIKGGLAVDIGVEAFLPGSQADLRPHPTLEDLIGQEISCKVVKLDRKRNNVVLSRRKVLEEENERIKHETLEKLAEGAVLTGRVKNLTTYGAFVDVGGIDGLLHLTDLSWTRVAKPADVVQVGQEIEVKVLKFDKEKGRVSLGIKQLTPDPWEEIVAQYHPGDRLTGRVVSLTDYGAFVELATGVEGLIHISEMSWSKRLKHPSKILKPEDRVEVAVLEVNPAQRRISLSLRQSLPDPWEGLPERMGPGTVVQGRVRHFTEFGAFVEVEEGVDGLIHVSNLSWTRNVKHPSEILRKGQQIEAVVLNVDTDSRRLSLGLKQLQPDIWENFFGKTNVGDVVHAKVTRKTSFGVFVEIEEGIEGLCHISEIENHRSGADSGIPKVGSELDFRIIRLNPEEKKISLSMRLSDSEAPEVFKAAKRQPERPSLSAMAEAFSSAGITATTFSRDPAADEGEN